MVATRYPRRLSSGISFSIKVVLPASDLPTMETMGIMRSFLQNALNPRPRGLVRPRGRGSKSNLPYGSLRRLQPHREGGPFAGLAVHRDRSAPLGPYFRVRPQVG